MSVERPIVLAARRADSGLAPAVAPRNPLVGIMAANSPLHDLLLAAAGIPLVMTSGNLSEEPIVTDNDGRTHPAARHCRSVRCCTIATS